MSQNHHLGSTQANFDSVQFNILLFAKQRSALQFVCGRKHRYYTGNEPWISKQKFVDVLAILDIKLLVWTSPPQKQT